MEDKWINVNDELPKLKRRKAKSGNLITIENSKEVIVTDGDDTWIDSYSFDEGFHKSITHWQPLILPSPPKT